MSNKNEEGRQEAEANPYNRKKSWHTDDAMPQDRTSADEGLFVPNPESNQGLSNATANGNPDDNAENTDASVFSALSSGLPLAVAFDKP